MQNSRQCSLTLHSQWNPIALHQQVWTTIPQECQQKRAVVQPATNSAYWQHIVLIFCFELTSQSLRKIILYQTTKYSLVLFQKLWDCGYVTPGIPKFCVEVRVQHRTAQYPNGKRVVCFPSLLLVFNDWVASTGNSPELRREPPTTPHMVGNYELQWVINENMLYLHGLRHQWLQQKHVFWNSAVICIHKKQYVVIVNINVQSFVLSRYMIFSYGLTLKNTNKCIKSKHCRNDFA